SGLRLALRAVAIPIRVIRDGLMPTGVTSVEMAPEGCRTTTRDRAEYRSLLHAQPRMLLDEGVCPCAWRISATSTAGRLMPGSASASAATVGGTTGVETCSCSNGCGAAG